MEITLTEKEEFMQEHLVVWLQSCLNKPEKLSVYENLIDGTLIYEVLLMIDPEPLYHTILLGQNDPSIRIQNINCILKNIKMLYEEELGQVILTMPDCLRLGREPYSKHSFEDMKLLLLLLLGCAVQCPNKESFIERIKTLPIESQHALVHYIKQITESQQIVITQENAEQLTTDLMISHIRQLVKERDQYLQMWTELEEKRFSNSKPLEAGGLTISISSSGDNQNYAIELADWKAKLRKLRHELEEKTEALAEAKEELEQTNLTAVKLKEELQQIKVDARSAKAYRDEVDALREKASNYEHLEIEIKKYKEKLGDLDYYKSREEELTQNNLLLQETRETLEEQLVKFRRRASQLQEMESQLLHFKQNINTMTLERDAHLRKIDELINENAQLDLLNKSFQCNESFNKEIDNDSYFDHIGSKDNSLCEQLSTSAQSHALRLELENKKLTSTIECLQDNIRHQNNEIILELEKDKKLLSLQLEETENNKNRLHQHSKSIENDLSNLKNEYKKLVETNELLKIKIEIKSEEFESLKRENKRLEKELKENSSLHTNEKSDLVQGLELKNNNLEKDVSKLKGTLDKKLEEIDNLISEIDMLKKEKEVLNKNLEDYDKQIHRLRAIENEFHDLKSKYTVEVAATKAVQDDLVSEKRKSQQIMENLDKLGLALDQSAEPENVLDQIVSSPEVVKAVREKITKDTNMGHEMNVAQMEVDLTTLKSKVHSLNSQHTALQLANTQLAAEKEETQKELDSTNSAFSKLQILHNQLTIEYEEQLKQKDSLKNDLKEARFSLKEKLSQLKSVETKLKRENELFKAELITVKHLPAEHAKLKDDFRALFTANEKLKADLRNGLDAKELVEVHEKEMESLKSKLTDSNARYMVLQQMTSTFVEDRRSLMEHVTMLITQYHELLTQSLEDKEQYHLEEKNNTDKLNHLSRQKEKLEEKIMDHYRKLNSCSITKKKTFGSTWIRKVKKAGTELMNKSRMSWHEDMARRGIDSDTSLDLDDNQSNHQEYSDNLSSLGTPGTRQTLYLSGEENDVDEGSIIASHSLSNSPLTPSYRNEQKLPHTTDDEIKDSSNNSTVRSSKTLLTKEDTNWYEYGCV